MLLVLLSSMKVIGKPGYWFNTQLPGIYSLNPDILVVIEQPF